MLLLNDVELATSSSSSPSSSSLTGGAGKVAVAVAVAALVQPFQNCLPEESTKLKMAMAMARSHWAANRSQARALVMRRW